MSCTASTKRQSRGTALASETFTAVTGAGAADAVAGATLLGAAGGASAYFLQPASASTDSATAMVVVEGFIRIELACDAGVRRRRQATRGAGPALGAEAGHSES
jgi:hypothetical protein